MYKIFYKPKKKPFDYMAFREEVLNLVSKDYSVSITRDSWRHLHKNEQIRDDVSVSILKECVLFREVVPVEKSEILLEKVKLFIKEKES